MPKICQIRGAILEELVLELLGRAGYRILDEDDGVELRNGSNGLEVQGRGEWHQVDALVSYDFTPAFIYPLRLIVEAKAYLPRSRGGKVGIDVVRNAVGVLKDINENYFLHNLRPGQEYKFRIFNYVYAIFSLYGFTRNAQRYAMAHQIFLIQYHHAQLFENIKHLLALLDDDQTSQEYFYHVSDIDLCGFRKRLRNFLKSGNKDVLSNYLTEKGISLMCKLKNELDHIGGSYFGLLNGEYPIHILSEKPIKGIGNEDVVSARVYVTKEGQIKVAFKDNKLFFELPEDVARIFSEVWDKKRKIAKLKKKYISFITLSGKIGGIRRSIRIELDRDWLREYISHV